jgi:hypothetical protein
MAPTGIRCPCHHTAVRPVAIDTYAGRVDALTVVVVVALAAGLALLVLGPVLLALAVSSGRQRRWVSRHAVVPCAALRPGSRLPRRLAVYGATVAGPGGPVVAPLSGVEAVWFRTMACSTVTVGDPGLTTTRILWEQSGGEPFGVADGTGTVAVSAKTLQWSTYIRHMSGKARSRHSVGLNGPSPVRTLVDEDITSHRRRSWAPTASPGWAVRCRQSWSVPRSWPSVSPSTTR